MEMEHTHLCYLSVNSILYCAEFESLMLATFRSRLNVSVCVPSSTATEMAPFVRQVDKEYVKVLIGS